MKRNFFNIGRFEPVKNTASTEDKLIRKFVDSLTPSEKFEAERKLTDMNIELRRRKIKRIEATRSKQIAAEAKTYVDDLLADAQKQFDEDRRFEQETGMRYIW